MILNQAKKLMDKEKKRTKEEEKEKAKKEGKEISKDGTTGKSEKKKGASKVNYEVIRKESGSQSSGIEREYNPHPDGILNNYLVHITPIVSEATRGLTMLTSSISTGKLSDVMGGQIPSQWKERLAHFP